MSSAVKEAAFVRAVAAGLRPAHRALAGRAVVAVTAGDIVGALVAARFALDAFGQVMLTGDPGDVRAVRQVLERRLP